MRDAKHESVSLSRTLRMTTSPGQPLPSSRPSNDRKHTESALAGVILAAQLPVGVSREMADWFIVSAERAGEKLVNEAKKSTPWPRELLDKSPSAKDPPGIVFLCREDDINLFEHVPKQPENPKRSFWGQLRPSRRRAKHEPPSATKTTARAFATTHAFLSIQHLVALLGPRSLESASLLHPDASLMLHVHTLLDLAQEHVCLRTVAIPATDSASSVREPRDFLVVEYRHELQVSATGRRGFVAAYHSVSWSGSPSATQPGAVRASAYTSGIVALESETVPGRVELYSVAEVNLKGDATARDNAAFARQRVRLMLARTTAAAERTALAALALDADRVFEIARRTSVHRQQQACVTCARTTSQLDGSGEALAACRKCYALVCGECSRVWRYGRQELRFCVACWQSANAAVAVGRHRNSR